MDRMNPKLYFRSTAVFCGPFDESPKRWVPAEWVGDHKSSGLCICHLNIQVVVDREVKMCK